MYVISSPNKLYLYSGARIKITCRLHVLHVDKYALMVRTCELYLVRGQPNTVPADGDMVIGNIGSERPRTYPTGKFPTARKQCGFNLVYAPPILLDVSKF